MTAEQLGCASSTAEAGMYVGGGSPGPIYGPGRLHQPRPEDSRVDVDEALAILTMDGP
jgi:hypothetical protein